MSTWPQIVMIVLMATRFAGPLGRAIGAVEVKPREPEPLWITAVNTVILVMILKAGGFWAPLR